jgi:hypothetical protein
MVLFWVWTRARQHAWLSFGEGIIVGTSNGSSFEDSLRMKARPDPREGMVKIVERSAMQIRRGPVRAILPAGGKWESGREFINMKVEPPGRVIHSLVSAGFSEAFARP